MPRQQSHSLRGLGFNIRICGDTNIPSIIGDKNGLELEAVVAQHSDCTKCDWIVLVKMIDFMLCEFHLKNKNKGSGS